MAGVVLAAAGACTIATAPIPEVERARTIEISASSEDLGWAFPALPGRPGAAEGAAMGAADGVFTSLSASSSGDDFGTILLLPVLVPLFAVAGAAAAPDDAEWAEFEAAYQRELERQQTVYRILRARDLGQEMEERAFSALRAHPGGTGKCVTPATGGGCGAPVARVALRATPRVVGQGYRLKLHARIDTGSETTCIETNARHTYPDPANRGAADALEELPRIRALEAAALSALANKLYGSPPGAEESFNPLRKPKKTRVDPFREVLCR